MYSPVRLARKYLHYYLTAANGKGHGIHSPFVFDFITSVLNDRGPYPAWVAIEVLRDRLLKDDTLLNIEDMGAGSAWSGTETPGAPGTVGFTETGTPALRPRPQKFAKCELPRQPMHLVHRRRISDIARRAAKPPRLGQLLFRVARHYRPGTIVELGTSLGLSTAYLAAGAPDAKVWTIEGSPAIAKTAADNLRGLGLDNVEVSTGNFDDLLEPLLGKIGPVELAFVDGNHRRDPTLRYFDSLMHHSGRSAVLIFDDIHWSQEMEQAWESIRNDPRVYLTIDLFFFGFVFLRDEFKVKQDFTIRF
jgi:predicted O-methyltransferase YrrM